MPIDKDEAATVGGLVGAGETRLEAAGVPASRLDAEVLMAHCLGTTRAGLLGRWREEVPPVTASRFQAMIDRRADRYPLQYLTGRQEFYSLEFEVNERVLIPRPETEMIVDEVIRLDTSKSLGASTTGVDGPMVVDVGTGSGCIAVAIAVQLPKARIL